MGRQTENRELILTEPFTVAEQMPVFTGGDASLLQYLAENTVYPENAKNKGIQGRVIVRFCITERGTVSRVSVLNSVDPELDAEAVRVVKTLPAFNPGKTGRQGSSCLVHGPDNLQIEIIIISGKMITNRVLHSLVNSHSAIIITEDLAFVCTFILRNRNSEKNGNNTPSLMAPPPPKPPSMSGGDTIWNFAESIPTLPGNEEALFDYIGRNLRLSRISKVIAVYREGSCEIPCHP